MRLRKHFEGETRLAICLFPCNQFGKQEAGSSEEVAKVAAERTGDEVQAGGEGCSAAGEFDLFQKVEVNGPQAHPLFKWMRRTQPSTKIRTQHSGCP